MKKVTFTNLPAAPFLKCPTSFYLNWHILQTYLWDCQALWKLLTVHPVLVDMCTWKRDTWSASCKQIFSFVYLEILTINLTAHNESFTMLFSKEVFALPILFFFFKCFLLSVERTYLLPVSLRHDINITHTLGSRSWQL